MSSTVSRLAAWRVARQMNRAGSKPKKEGRTTVDNCVIDLHLKSSEICVEDTSASVPDHHLDLLSFPWWWGGSRRSLTGATSSPARSPGFPTSSSAFSSSDLEQREDGCGSASVGFGGDWSRDTPLHEVPPPAGHGAGARTQRNPPLSTPPDGPIQPRSEMRRNPGPNSHEPPRNTRELPDEGPCGSVAGELA